MSNAVSNTAFNQASNPSSTAPDTTQNATVESLMLSEDVFVFPASFSQQRIWLLDQLEGDSATYNMSMTMLLSGALDINVLERSLSTLVDRHEALRTNFQMVNDSLVQVVAETADFRMTVEDYSLEGKVSPVEPKTQPETQPKTQPEIEEWISRATQRPFNLEKDPLFRVKLLRLSSAQHVLQITMHHIISDAWSMGVFKKELSTLYKAFKQGDPSPLEPLQIQYADFADWQRDYLSGDRLKTHLDYWRQKLEGIPPLLALPTDRPRPAIQTFKGKTTRFMLSAELTQQLKALSQQSQSTLFMTLLSAFSILLARYTHSEDIVIGSPIANRQQRELEPLIGCFVNTLVLRAQLKGNPTFEEVLAQVRQTALEAYERQDLPFERLVEELQPERSLSHSPLFQVMFILQNTPKAARSLVGLDMTPIKRKKTVAKFDLTLAMTERKEGLSGSFEYNSDLFDSATIDRAIGHFQTLLEGIACNPKQPISELPILTRSERQQLLIDWNDTADSTFLDQCIHELFEQQAAKTPAAIALTLESPKGQPTEQPTEQLTYQILNQRANQLAQYLKTRNLPPETLVGICLERSPNMMIALLGTLKAGLAYVPLDPTYPDARISFTLSDADIPLLLTQQSLVPQLSKHSVNLICLDKDWDAIAATAQNSETERSAGKISPDQRAYVIYTSGSTGQPKGVEVCHRSVSNFLQAMANKPGLTAQDALLSVTTLSFDIAALELFLPLTVGAKVMLVSSEVAADATLLQPVLSRCNATVMQATPATWQMLIASGWKGNPHLKLLCGGEALPLELAKQLIARSNDVWNMYGPTEATIWSTCKKIAAADKAVSIGRPIANTQTYILDKFQNPVPIGVSGELHIGGAGLAKGYLHRPELTERQFISHPFAAKINSKPNSRLYKTGDLARYWPDGQIECLGRIDNQIKLRGFRIELGEIESVLAQQNNIQQAAVIVREDIPGDRRLVAYCVTQDPTSPSIEAQRNHLQQQLPHYMVPSTFVWLETLPQTPNGKVDRAALPAPDWSSQSTAVESTPPSTPTEQAIANVWTDVLNLSSVGIHDNFFALGGHSLLAAQVISRLRSILDIDLSLRHLFEATTIAEFACLAEDLRTKQKAGATSKMTIPRSSRRR